MIAAINIEIEYRKFFLKSKEPVKTIYFGGGTPSLLRPKLIDSILNTIQKNFALELEEVTLEANPDDMEQKKLSDFKSMGIDRLSIGIQSFDDQILKFYNRSHNREEAIKAVAISQSAGFEKLSIDLIYGFPHQDHSIWNADLEMALAIDPGHISSYGLTVEPKTALGNWLKKGTFLEASEDFQAEQFERLMIGMEKAGYIQYEISNFGKPGQFAIHNTNYWKGIPYLGIGPGAHSFDGKQRGYNIANNAKYIKGINDGFLPFHEDTLSDVDILNEYILTSLRTIWGCNLEKIRNEFSVNLLEKKESILSELQDKGLIVMKATSIQLTKKGKLLADSIAASLFI
jgi:oxygen-independent coproporphyrinogen-3 oxidase